MRLRATFPSSLSGFRTTPGSLIACLPMMQAGVNDCMSSSLPAMPFGPLHLELRAYTVIPAPFLSRHTGFVNMGDAHRMVNFDSCSRLMASHR
jgi:hypothetical protein